MMVTEPFCYPACYPEGWGILVRAGEVVGTEGLAGMAEVVDAEVSKTSGSDPLRVRVPLPVFEEKTYWV